MNTNSFLKKKGTVKNNMDLLEFHFVDGNKEKNSN